MNRRLRLLILVPAIMAGILAVVSFVVSTFYAEDVKQLLIGQINRHLKTEIKVKDFGFSIWKNFPYVSFELNQVLIPDPTDANHRDTLLQADRISLLFNVVGLFKDDIVIRKVVADRGVLHVRLDTKGDPNYEIWEADTASTASELDLSEVRLRDMHLTYFDQLHDQDYSFHAHDVKFSGTFGEDRFDMAVKGKLDVKRLKSAGTCYIENKPAEIAASMEVDSRSDQYRFGESTIRLGEVSFSVNGGLETKEDVNLDLSIDADKADLHDFILLLPKKYAGVMDGFSTSGKVEFRSTIKGKSSKSSDPVFNADFSLSDGTLRPEGEKVELENIRFSGKFRSGPKGELLIRKIQASLDAYPVNADVRVSEFSDPFLEVHAASRINLAALKGFLRLDTLESLSGTAQVDIDFSGRLRNMNKKIASEISAIKSSGKVELQDVNFRLKTNPLQFGSINGRLSLRDADVVVDALSGKISSSDFKIDGTISNLVGFLLVKDQMASFHADFTSSSIDLDELLINKAASNAQDTSYKLKLNPRLSGNMNVAIGHIKFRKFRATDLSGKVRLTDQALYGQGLRFQAMQGQLAMDAVINASRSDSVVMSCDANLQRLDIRQLFYELENFDQDVMTDRNVKGRMSANVQFRSMWSRDLSINPATARATCDITIENGELNDFGPILQLSKYLKVKDLRNIRFSTLHNVISISKEVITIPTMEIKSTAIDITANGTHDFDNRVDYHIIMLLSDVLGRKVKQQNSEFGEIEDDGLGKTRLFLSMKGPVDDPKITYDRKAVGEKIRADVNREKNTIRQIMKEEFGLFKKDTIKKVDSPKKKEELQIEW
ncbi:MAG: AsmA-like C-terminal region-containing protein [Bacteroidota bacterium]